MRMGKLAGERGLVHELHGIRPVEVRALYELGIQYLQCHVLAREGVEGEIDRTRCAFAENSPELEFADSLHETVTP